jgi:hypothetical protein
MHDEEFMKAGGHKAFKPMEVITCSDGTTFPNTGMGGQAAAQHEAGLTYVRPKAKFGLTLTWGDFRYSLSVDQFVVSKTEREPGKSSTWYPVHIGWTKGAPKGRHIKIQRKYISIEDRAAARKSERSQVVR